MANKLNKWFKNRKNMSTEKEREVANEAQQDENLTRDVESIIDETQTESEESNELPKSNEALLEEKIKVTEDKYLRLFSEFENYRKRTQKEKAELIAASKGDVFKLILPVLDDFERALKSINTTQEVASLKEGVELIHAKMLKSLQSQGLEIMECKDLTFNADEHEAITNIPAPNDDLKGKVIDVVETGYKLNDKIIRYPKVVVGS